MVRQFGNADSKYVLEETGPGVFRILVHENKESLGVFSVKDLMQLSLTIDALIDSSYDLSKGSVWPEIARPLPPSRKK